MTREEKAIIYFKDMRKRLCEDYLKICPKDSIAYNATLAEKDFYDTAINALEQEPCSDAISRKAAIGLADELKDDSPDDDRLSDMVMSHNEGILDYQTKLSLLPSVSSQQRMGRWIEHFDEIGKWYECDQCHTDWGGSVNYCPNCGCKMEEGNELLR